MTENLEQPSPGFPGPLWIKITGNAAGTNRYSWEQVNEADTPSFGTGVAAGFKMSGTSAVNGWPAYEVNGRTDLAVDGSVRVRAWMSVTGDCWLFQFAGTASTSLTIYGIPFGPTLTNRTSITFSGDDLATDNFSNGLSVIDSPPSGAIVSLDFATSNHGGVVSKVAQIFAGDKDNNGYVQTKRRFQASNGTVSGGFDGIMGIDAGTGVMGVTAPTRLVPVGSVLSGFLPRYNPQAYFYSSSHFLGISASMVMSVLPDPVGHSEVWITPNSLDAGSGNLDSGSLFLVGRYCVLEPAGGNQGTRWVGNDSNGSGTGGMIFKGGIYVGGGNGTINGGSF